MEKYYLTTAIDYVNGAPHIGHAYEKIITDIIARHYSQRTDNMFFLTGTDEHGIKIQKTAASQGITPKELCDTNAQKFKDAWKALDVNYNKFIRTTDEEHEKIVQKIFQKLKNKGDIYKHEYEGWYCVPDESFWTESQLVDGKCPDCGRQISVFGESQVDSVAEEIGLQVLGKLPIDPAFAKLADEGRFDEVETPEIAPAVEKITTLHARAGSR